MSQTHQVLEEGNKTPMNIRAVLHGYDEREPPTKASGRIALGLTLLREMDAKVALRWFQVFRSHWWPGPVYNGRGQYTVQARNYVLEQFFAELGESEALFYWDSDQVPPLVVPGPLPNGWQGGYFTDYLDYLLDHEPDKEVIAGLYFSREDYWQTDEAGKVKAGPHEPLAYWTNADGGYRFLTDAELIPMLQRPGLHPIKAAGTGSMLIRKSLLLEMAELKAPRPVFEASMIEPGDKRGLVGSQWTEDVYFCHEVQTRLHKTIWLDTAMQSAHVAEIWVNAAHYLEARGYQTQPHPQSMKGRPVNEHDTGKYGKVNRTQEEERRRSRIILPR